MYHNICIFFFHTVDAMKRSVTSREASRLRLREKTLQDTADRVAPHAHACVFPNRGHQVRPNGFVVPPLFAQQNVKSIADKVSQDVPRFPVDQSSRAAPVHFYSQDTTREAVDHLTRNGGPYRHQNLIGKMPYVHSSNKKACKISRVFR